LANEKEKAHNSGKMDQNTLETGVMIKPTEKADLFMIMAMCMKASGTMIKLRAKVYTNL
jgi:hypothetical protein